MSGGEVDLDFFNLFGASVYLIPEPSSRRLPLNVTLLGCAKCASLGHIGCLAALSNDNLVMASATQESESLADLRFGQFQDEED